MDPLSALAIATAVVQFAEFGGKILLRTWSRYKGRLAEEEDVQVSKLVDDLSGLSNSVRDRTEGFWEDSAASPSELHLSRICSECDSVTAEFRDVLGQLSRRRKAKKDTKLEQLVLAGLWDDRRIKQMADRLEILRQQVMTAILFCLWHDSKRAQQRELHFATQLNGILEIVQRVDDSISQRSDSNTPSQLANQPSSWTPVVNGIMDIVVESGHPETLKPPDAAGRVRERTSTMATTILPIIEAGKAVSISRIGEEVVKALSKSESAKQIRDDLVQILWTKEWTLDTSTVSASKMKIHTQLDVAVISKTVCVGLMFQGMTIREGAIAKAFESTYEWIFSREPKKLDGKLLWDSFPDWLESNTNTPYWLSGKPGSGKSTIIKFMANNSHLKRHLSKWAGPLPVFLSTYYAWNSGFSMQKTWEGLKRTVLYQVIEQSPSLIPIIAPRRWVLVQALRDPTAALPQWISWEIDEAFEALLSECGRSMRLVLFVDGLDEFEMPPSEVVARIRSLSRRAGDGIKMAYATDAPPNA
ncbi:hypothetical protein NKR23_g4326 [Pleurostoma richardsiae]|uniref:Nephrocystin 3-like N-terminal domain-containing protein n=1 Tax=Pleurostoma richardsiae TaxID=41990 RepID=A0AA38RGR4_9PEZI|nr:hypothetical protein NKR23_g4326 [Pleurostoma richardsiae]